MNKKILGAAATVIFCNCLIVGSGVQNENIRKEKAVQRVQLQKGETVTEDRVAIAGVSLVLSRSSFTTESDEKASINRNETVRVAIPENAVAEEQEEVTIQQQGETEEEKETTMKTQPEETAAQEDVRAQNRWGITLTAEEIDLLADIVWLEANGEPELGQQAVVEVIFNRMTSELFPNTLYDVLSQKNPVQFCSWKNRNRAKPTEKEYQSISQVLSGNTSILRSDTLYFSREALTSNIDVRIGEHSFCY